MIEIIDLYILKNLKNFNFFVWLLSAFSKWLSKLITNEAHPKEYYVQDLTRHVPDHGTSHVIAIDHEGNGVSITSTINQLYVLH